MCTDGHAENPGLSILCSSYTQFEEIAGQLERSEVPQEYAAIDELMIELDSFSGEDIKKARAIAEKADVRLITALPEIFRKECILPECDGFLVRGVDELEYVRTAAPDRLVIADYGFYCMNAEAADFMMEHGVSRITAPVELNEHEITRLAAYTGKNSSNKDGTAAALELVVYGYLPMMVSAQCIRKNLEGCDHTPGLLELTDRIGKRIPVRNVCSECYNILYNPNPLSLFGVTDRVKKTGIKRIRIDFSIEGRQEIGRILRAFYERKDPKHFTRGHFGRGVE